MTGTDRGPGGPGLARMAVIAAAAVAAMGVAAIALWPLLAPRDRFADCPGVAIGASIGGPFTLVSETGETVTDKEVLAQPSLVYFGYTFCPDVCPTDAARNAEAVDLLAERGMAVQPVFITVDPARDTTGRLREFTDAMHPAMLGLTGTTDQVAVAAAAFRAYFKRHESADPYYPVDHSTQTYLMLPDLGFVTFFRSDDTPAAVAEGTACYLKNA
ncbi:MAG: SCO family protein [Paracoccaceae bacterium]